MMQNATATTVAPNVLRKCQGFVTAANSGPGLLERVRAVQYSRTNDDSHKKSDKRKA